MRATWSGRYPTNRGELLISRVIQEESSIRVERGPFERHSGPNWQLREYPVFP